MLRSFKRGTTGFFLAALGALACTLALAAAPHTGAPAVTVGDFLLMYAEAANLRLPADATAETAREALKAARILPDLELSLDRVMTHGEAVRLGRAAGMRITSRTPEQELERAEAELFLETFSRHLGTRIAAGTELRTSASDNPPGNPAGKARTDRGKKKGRPFQSPSEPCDGDSCD